MALTPLQQRLAALVAGLPEADGFALAGGAGLAAHELSERPTRDLDYFGSPGDRDAVHRLADALERACADHGLTVRRDRQAEAFVRLAIEDPGVDDACEVDIAIDYRAFEPVPTRHGLVLDHAMSQVERIPQERLDLDEDADRALQATVHRWRTHVQQLRDHDLRAERDALRRRDEGPELGL